MQSYDLRADIQSLVMAEGICQYYGTQLAVTLRGMKGLVMSNEYEVFRGDIQAAILETVVKVTSSGAKSYDWSSGKIFTATGEKCKMPDVTKLPEDFKTIVRFELDKLRHEVNSNDGFVDKRTKLGYVNTRDGIELQRNVVSNKAHIPLAEKLRGARILADAYGKGIARAKTAEAASRIRKALNRVHMQIDHLNAEIARQNELQAEVAKLATSETLDGVKVEVVGASVN